VANIIGTFPSSTSLTKIPTFLHLTASEKLWLFLLLHFYFII